MSYTSHGHAIPGLVQIGKPKMVARCGGPGVCVTCSTESCSALIQVDIIPYENQNIDPAVTPNGPRMFKGYRPNPPNDYVEKGVGHGGLKADYEGAVYSDGTVVIRWLTDFRSHSVWSCWEDFYKVHGHPEYGTIIKFSPLLDLGDD